MKRSGLIGLRTYMEDLKETPICEVEGWRIVKIDEAILNVRHIPCNEWARWGALKMKFTLDFDYKDFGCPKCGRLVPEHIMAFCKLVRFGKEKIG